MGIIRILLLAFNVGVVTFLIYRLLEVARISIEKSKKIVIVSAGLMLLILPIVMLTGIIRPSPLYLFLYPVATFANALYDQECEKRLDNQHGVTIRQELVFFLLRSLISLHDQIVTTKSSGHHQQR